MTISAIILMMGTASVSQFTCPAFIAGEVPVVIAGTLSAESNASTGGFRVRLDTDRGSKPYDLHASINVMAEQTGKRIVFVRMSKDSDPHNVWYSLNFTGGAANVALAPPHIVVNGGDDSQPEHELLSADCTLVKSGTPK